MRSIGIRDSALALRRASRTGREWLGQKNEVKRGAKIALLKCMRIVDAPQKGQSIGRPPVGRSIGIGRCVSTRRRVSQCFAPTATATARVLERVYVDPRARRRAALGAEHLNQDCVRPALNPAKVLVTLYFQVEAEYVSTLPLSTPSMKISA